MNFILFKKKSIIIAIIIIALIACTTGVYSFVTAKKEILPIYDYTIVLDAGHGGIDSGGIGSLTKCKESEINLSITKKVASYLKSFGVRVVLTRENDGGLYGIYSKGYKKRDMQARKDIINNCNANMVVSIHMNRFPKSSTRGAQVFYDLNSTTSQALALCIQNQFAKNLPESDKGISIGDYYMLKCTDSPSVICECGFLSNSKDESLLLDNSYQEKVAYNIFCGIVEYLNISSSLKTTTP